MASEICRILGEQEMELKKNSIYILGDDEQDRDFEFFVLIDPDNTEDRPLFLKELHQVVINGEAGIQFAVSKHKNELKKWLCIESEDDPLLNPLNWLKIAIERYPYRLFIVINENEEDSGDKDKWPRDIHTRPINQFIKKRVCFINKDDFNTEINKDTKGIRKWLFKKWIMHLCDMLGFTGKLKLEIDLDYFSDESFYEPSSLYKDLNASGSETNTPNDFDLTIDTSSSGYLILYRRHDLIYTFRDKWTCNSKLYQKDNPLKRTINYIEASSGGLSYFSELQSASVTGNLKLVENGMLRILIIDERLQEWANELSTNVDTKYISNLYQMRVLIGFLENVNLYGQKDNKQPYEAVWDGIDKFILSGGMTVNFHMEACLHNDLKIESIDVLIIHQGILDKWCNEKKLNLDELIFKWKEKIPFIIVTSGRGKPEVIPYGVKFLPFSNIEKCLSGNYFEKLKNIKQVFNLKEDIK